VGFNVYETVITIDTLGDEVAGDLLTSPTFDAYNAGVQYVRVLAEYATTEDRFPADTWEVYIEEGIDPVPGVDTPAYSGAMSILGGLAGLTKRLGTYTAGATAHIIVTALRSSDNARSSSVVTQLVLSESIDVDATLFGGTQVERR